MSTSYLELDASKLRRVCSPERFTFQSTAELPTLKVVVGQDRAVRAVSFGIDIESPGYHMYALRPPGTGKSTTIPFAADPARDRSGTCSGWGSPHSRTVQPVGCQDTGWCADRRRDIPSGYDLPGNFCQAEGTG